MIEIEPDQSWPQEFSQAAMSIGLATPRPELEIEVLPTQNRLAEHSLALAASVKNFESQEGADAGTGRLVLLSDPGESFSWGGPFRIVCFAKSPLETELGADGPISEVAWSWLIDALNDHQAGFFNEAGTTTRIISTGHGALAHHGDHAELEIRASWTPTDGRIDRHFQAWQDLICMLSGLPPRQVNSVPAPVGSVQHSDVGEPEGANFDEKGPGSTSEIN